MTKETFLEAFPPYPPADLTEGLSEEENKLVEKTWHGAIDAMIALYDK